MRLPVCILLLTSMALAVAASALAAPQRARPAAPTPQQALAPPEASGTVRPPSGRAPAGALAERAGALVTSLALGDLGFTDGIRFANLGGRRDLFVPLPQGADIAARELVLVLDDISAHEARRSLEILVNDRSAAAVALDGRSVGRTLRIPLNGARPREGYLKLTLQYSGAATPDRCIDVRYVGDSLTVKPDTALTLAVDFGAAGPDIATAAALLPREVALLLPGRRPREAEIATALTVARALAVSGRRIAFHYGHETLPFLAKREGAQWSRGIIVIGGPETLAASAESWPIRIAGPAPGWGLIAVAHVGGAPVFLISDADAARAGRLFGRPLLAGTRGLAAATVGDSVLRELPRQQVSFDQLGIELPQAQVFGRAELKTTLDRRLLPPATRPTRLLLDLLIAPDGTGENAVVTAYVNEQPLATKVAAQSEATRFDLSLPDGLVGIHADLRLLVQRRSAQGDCRFEPQGYPAHLLGSSAVVLADASARASDFHDLAAAWSAGVDVLLPRTLIEPPAQALDLVAQLLAGLAPEGAPITVTFIESGATPAPTTAFLAVGERPPAGASPPVRFDQGRVAVADRAGRTLLDLGGFSAGAVGQIVSAGPHTGLWIRPLAGDGSLPAPQALRLDRGNVAFIDASGVALAMSTERDTLVRIRYPDQVSWLTLAERFRAWIIGALWLLATVGFVLALQRYIRRRAARSDSAGD